MRSDLMGENQRWQWLEREINKLEQSNSLRQLHDTLMMAGGRATRDGRVLLNLASNDYLGLAIADKSTLENADAAVTHGSGASRLVSGNHPMVSQFEREFAKFKGAESVLLFNSGYTANLGVLSALCGRGDVVYSDRLNHASMIDGILLSRAELIRYKHRDMNELEDLLKRTSPNKRTWLVSDAVFSMDGTVAPLHDLVFLKEKYGAYLYIDEAHSGGVFGDGGQGLAHQLGLSEKVDVLMGTFSKSYGVFGAYVACPDVVRQYLINKSRSFIYATALPPTVVATIRKQWLRAQAESWRRERVLSLAEQFRSGLKELGLDPGESETQIVPLILGSNELTLKWAKKLQARGVLAVAIRPPTVPEGTARIRFSWTAAHEEQDVREVLSIISDTCTKLGGADGVSDNGRK